MLSMKIKNDVISELYYNGKNIIEPWGIEAGDTDAFFSLERGIGYRYKEINNYSDISQDRYRYQKTIEMHDGIWKLQEEDLIVGNRIVRHVIATCLEDTFFLDFVMRFRFKKEYFEQAVIAGRTITHCGSNIYHQYVTDHIELDGQIKAKIRIIDSVVPEKMTPNLYVRDFRDEWVVHARMIPNVCDKKVIKLCNRFCKTKPLPQWMTNLLCKNEIIYEYLKYHNEKTPYKNWFMRKVCPNAFPLILVPKGEKLMWNIEVLIEDE